MLPALREAVPGLVTVIHAGDAADGADGADGVREVGPDDALDYEDLIAGADPIDDARRGGDELAGVFYTGGTTGFPKGVMISHANLAISWLGSAATGCLGTSGSRTLHTAPMFHLADLAYWGATLLLGGSHVIIGGFDPVSVFSAIAGQRVTDVLLVPTMIQILADHPEVTNYDLTSLRSIVYGASPISQAVLERAMKAFPSAAFTQAYGMTELSPVATILSPAEHEQGHLRSAGRAAPHAEVRVVDPDEQGYLYVVDRIKDMIITGGENVYSAEVENAVARHPAAVTGKVLKRELRQRYRAG
jgi:acyl-CoA synthetase (AMP-forming)/AMP-acid ligase II